jgi:uncharacterized protein YacL
LKIRRAEEEVVVQQVVQMERGRMVFGEVAATEA